MRKQLIKLLCKWKDSKFLIHTQKTTKELHQGINEAGRIILFCMKNLGTDTKIIFNLAKVDSHIHRVKTENLLQGEE